MKDIRFKLRSGKIVVVSLTEELLQEIKQGRRLTLQDLYSGYVLFGSMSEYCAFDGTQVEKVID
jgi:uncharacterized protein YrrD